MIKRILSGVIFAFWATSTALALPDINQINPLPAPTEPDPAQKAHIQKTYGKLPLFFIQNDGQLDKQVRFYEKGSGHATYFTAEGVTLTLTKHKAETNIPFTVSRTVASLGAGASSTATTNVTVPAVNPGTYYIGAIADAGNAQIETNASGTAEANNSNSPSAVSVTVY